MYVSVCLCVCSGNLHQNHSFLRTNEKYIFSIHHNHQIGCRRTRKSVVKNRLNKSVFIHQFVSSSFVSITNLKTNKLAVKYNIQKNQMCYFIQYFKLFSPVVSCKQLSRLISVDSLSYILSGLTTPQHTYIYICCQPTTQCHAPPINPRLLLPFLFLLLAYETLAPTMTLSR